MNGGVYKSSNNDIYNALHDNVFYENNTPSINFTEWEDTGNKKPGQFFGDLWPDVERRCAFCGETMWFSN